MGSQYTSDFTASQEHQTFGGQKLHSRLVWLALLCAGVGVFTSVGICAGNHIFLLIPSLIAIRKCLFKERKSSLPKSAWALLALCLVGFSANIYNWNDMHDPLRCTMKLKYFMMGILGMMALRCLHEPDEPRKFQVWVFNLALASIIVSVSYAIIGHVTGFDLIDWKTADFTRRGGLTGTMRFGYGMGMLLPSLIGILVFCGSKMSTKQKTFLKVAVVFAIIGLLLTQTRGGLLATISGFVVLAFMVRRSTGVKTLLVGAGVIFVIFFVNAFIDSNEKGWRNSGYFRGLNDGQRISIYQGALASIRERPVKGLGYYQLGYHLPEIKRRNGIANVDGETSHAHNIFLQIGADFGILGLLTLMAWLGFWARELISRGGLPMKLGLPFIAAITVGGQFEYIFDGNNSVLIFTVYAVSLSPFIHEIFEEKNSQVPN